MAKAPLTNIAAGYALTTTINTNNSTLETAIDNTLSRDGTSPNQMGAQLDMNSYPIVNLPDAVNNQSPITLSQAGTIAGVTNPITQETVGSVLYPETAAETAAAITPTNYYYPEGNVLRYGATGDGVTDDATALQNAINVAEQGSSSVFFPAGTYITGTQLTIDSSDVTVYGEGRQSKIKTTADINMIRATGADRITVRDIAFEGNSTGSAQDGIRCINVEDSVFHNIYVTSVGHDGILLISGCVGCTISQCHVDASGDDGINVGGDNSTASTDNTVVGCVAENCTNDGIHISDGSLRTTVTGNVTKGNGYGIGLYNANRVAITGNAINSNTNYGVYTPSGTSSYVTITGNTFNGGTRGVNVDAGTNYSITGNVFNTTTEYGIVLSRTSKVVMETTIANNVFDGGCSESAIYLSGVTDVSVSGNAIGTVTGDGIFVKSSTATYGCANINITGNNIKGVGDEGIVVESGTDSEHIIIQGNMITGSTGDGIEYRGGPYFSIQGNSVVDAAAYGLLVSAAVLGDGKGVVCGNIVEGGCTTEGIRVNNYNEVIVSNNVVYDITGATAINAPAGNVVITGNLGEDTFSGGSKGLLTVSAAAGTTPGSCTNKVEIFDEDGASIGYIPIYDAIT